MGLNLVEVKNKEISKSLSMSESVKTTFRYVLTWDFLKECFGLANDRLSVIIYVLLWTIELSFGLSPWFDLLVNDVLIQMQFAKFLVEGV